MQTIKGLTALLLAAAAVFAIGGTISLRSQAEYAAELRNTGAEEMAGKAAGHANGAMSGGAVGLNAGANVANATTNITRQARLRAPRT
jgi:hypothetical protein